MQRKVLVVNKITHDKKEFFGLLCLESGDSLHGRLKVFEPTYYDCLLVQIGDNVLVFDDVKDTKNFEFETIFHDINLPVCAVLTVGGKLVGVAKTDGAEIDENKLVEEGKNLRQKIVLQSKNKDDNNVKEKDDLKEKVENTDNFFEMIKPQLDTLFSQSEHFKELEERLEGTEWVKVMFDGNGSDHYILGKLFDGDIITHIAYGTYAESQKEKPPQGLEEYCQFLPLNPQDENSQGYYVMYQDAITGENVII